MLHLYVFFVFPKMPHNFAISWNALLHLVKYYLCNDMINPYLCFGRPGNIWRNNQNFGAFGEALEKFSCILAMKVLIDYFVD